MKKIKMLTMIITLVIPILFTACCNCGGKEEYILKGQIIIIGNEPFTQLALRMEDEKVFALECEKELEIELRKNQGRPYSVMYKDSRVDNGVPIIVVTQAQLLNEKSK